MTEAKGWENLYISSDSSLSVEPPYHSLHYSELELILRLQHHPAPINMKLFESAVIVAVASIGVAGGTGGLIGKESVLCETSDASPLLHHISELIDHLREEDDDEKCFLDMIGQNSDSCGSTIKDYTGADGGDVFSLCSGDMDMWNDFADRTPYVRSAITFKPRPSLLFHAN